MFGLDLDGTASQCHPNAQCAREAACTPTCAGTFRHAAHRWTVGRCEVADITFAEPWTEPTLSIPRVLPLTLTLGLVLGSGIVHTARGIAGAWWKSTVSAVRTILSNTGDEEARRRLFFVMSR